VGKQEKITIKDLLSILKIKKQSLSRVLKQLVEQKYIIVSIGEDKRTKNLSLTKLGIELENQLSKIQSDNIKSIFRKFEENDINGFKKILYELINDENKKIFDKINT
jgi:DNA-binding MarR family transcriptional regulator